MLAARRISGNEHSHLRELAPDHLKISGDLAKRLGSDVLSGSLIESISRVGHAATIPSVAQWPENEEAIDALGRLGVDHIQGNLVRARYPLAAMP